MDKLNLGLYWYLINFRYATIAYVQQTPWLMKTTIRENILFGEAYRPRRYEKVLMSCALKEDIRCLPDGDLTEIGTNSLNLSGGQKSRIAIARALYSSANVVIMVNVYSNKNAYVYIQENKLIFCFIFPFFTSFYGFRHSITLYRQHTNTKLYNSLAK